MQGVGLVDLLGICKGVSPNSHLEGTGRVPFGGGRVWGRGQRRRQCTHRLVLGGRDRRVTGHRLGTLTGSPSTWLRITKFRVAIGLSYYLGTLSGLFHSH